MTLLTVWLAIAIIAAIGVLILRPRFLAKLGARGVPSRTEALIGKIGTVTQSIDPDSGMGRVLIAGEDWAAHCSTELSTGTRIHVVGADGIILKISPSEDDATSAKGPL